MSSKKEEQLKSVMPEQEAVSISSEHTGNSESAAKPAIPGKKPSQKNYFHIPADPIRVKAAEIQLRQAKRVQGLRAAEVSNQVIYEMLTDILDNQAVLDAKLQRLLKK
ncbi:hypothetical protein [Paenibacillus sp. J22TS3]|uniref:hypothetical protein n=1 Tax=Paenibacillus sp. J22TS3 TaxID=2807192 RepID=UPI001B131640|nr:hypothetical protein [Paenibacillus sp. J22TS3]GIP24221.1 hypothetical protein J22TS3_44960 [Paenibacillus sp. J22TS3]